MPSPLFSMSETFESIVGESTLSGFPALFVRFAGCNLRCAWCDTAYAYEPAYFFSHRELYEKVMASRQEFVLFTGGEPLLQPGLPDLINEIVSGCGKKVILETNGSVGIENVNSKAHISMDCKPPSSGEHRKCLFSNFQILKRTDDVKFVVEDRNDYEYSRRIIDAYDLEKRVNVVFQTVHGKLNAGRLAEWIVEDARPVRLNIQLHKHIGVK